MGKFRVLISCETIQFCDSLAAVIGEADIFKVVGKSTGSADLIDAASRLQPDIILWTVNGADPLPVITALCLNSPFVLPVILVDDPKRVNLMELLRVGVRGCLPTRLFPRQIVQSLELIVLAGMLCLPRPGPEFFNHHSNGNGQVSQPALSEREHQVLTLLGKSLSNQEMARALFLSESTVKTHLRSLFRKLGVRSRSEALLLAMHLGLTGRPEIFIGNGK